MRRRIQWTAAAALLGLILLPAPRLRAAPSGGDQERRAQAIEKLLVAPCCYKGTLDDHSSPLATQMRQEIRAQLATGRSKAQILAFYKKKYGQAVLAEPPKGGLSSFILYGIPFGLAILGLLVATVLIARRRRDEDGPNDHALPADHDLPPEMEERIDRLVGSSSAAPE